MSANYTEFIQEVWPYEKDYDLRYRRILSHIYNADLGQALSEISRLDFTHQSQLSLDFLKVLMLLDSSDSSTAIQYMNSVPNPFNIWERWAKNMLYTLALLKQSKRNTKALWIELAEVRKNNKSARLTRLLNASVRVENKKYDQAFNLFVSLHQEKNITEPLFLLEFARASYYSNNHQTTKSILEYLEESPKTEVWFYAIDKQKSQKYLFQTYYRLWEFENSIWLIRSLLAAPSIHSPSFLYNRLAKNYMSLWEYAEAYEFLIESLSHNSTHFATINDIIRLLWQTNDSEKILFLKQYIEKQIDNFSSKQLFTFSQLWWEIWDIDESERLLRFILAKFPTFWPARSLQKKQIIERYIVYRLSWDVDALTSTEQQLTEQYPDDEDINLIFAVDRLDANNAREALRYAQINDFSLTLDEVRMYLIVFLGYLEQDRVRSIAQEMWYGRSLWLSSMSQKLLEWRIAFQLWDEQEKSSVSFEIEAMRWSLEDLSDEEILLLFQQQFKKYWNFRDRFLAAEEIEEEEIEEVSIMQDNEWQDQVDVFWF